MNRHVTPRFLDIVRKPFIGNFLADQIVSDKITDLVECSYVFLNIGVGLVRILGKREITVVRLDVVGDFVKARLIENCVDLHYKVG